MPVAGERAFRAGSGVEGAVSARLGGAHRPEALAGQLVGIGEAQERGAVPEAQVRGGGDGGRRRRQGGEGGAERRGRPGLRDRAGEQGLDGVEPGRIGGGPVRAIRNG